MTHIQTIDFRAGRFYLEGSVDTPVIGYTDGSDWNGWATPVFDKDTAAQVMQSVNAANRAFEEKYGADDQLSVSYDAGQNAFLIHDPNYPDDDPQIVKGHDITVEGRPIHVYALGTRDWTWSEWEDD